MDEMIALDDLLHEMGSRIPGFIACDVVGIDGLSIAHHTENPAFDAEAASAHLALVVKLVQRAAAELDAGEVEDNLVTTAKTYIITRFLGDGSYLLVLAVSRKQAKLGNVRLVTRRYAPRIWEIMRH